MSRDENILSVYRNGNSQERMDLYLAYPGARVGFDEIERGEERRVPPGKATHGKRRRWGVCRRSPSPASGGSA